MRTVLALGLFILSGAVLADGLVRVRSAHDVATTADRLEGALRSKGMKVFARIDHAGGAAAAGMELRPTELLIFGNPKVGTPMMKCSQTMAIDLPQKALIWQAADGAVWLAYNDPAYLAGRHALGECGGIAAKVSQALGNFAAAATGP